MKNGERVFGKAWPILLRGRFAPLEKIFIPVGLQVFQLVLKRGCGTVIICSNPPRVSNEMRFVQEVLRKRRGKPG